MSLISFPTLNLAPIAPLGLETSQSTGGGVTTSDASQHSTWDASTVMSVIEGAISGAITGGPGGAIAGAGVGAADTSSAWSTGRVVAIVLGFLFIAGGILALTVSKETVINVAKTAAKAA